MVCNCGSVKTKLLTLKEINEMNNPNQIRIYSCGGAGLNIASYFETYRNGSDPGFASIDPVYIDTSKSNLTPSLPADSVYMVEGLDGSGKVRAENHAKIAECVLDILQKHRTGDLNIVLSSASGGSGSVIAPSLVSELLTRDVPTIAIIVGSTGSRIELENTIRTLKSYESIAQMRRTPVVGMYFENSQKTTRKSVDADIHTAIVLLAALFSGDNRELDSSDLRNWLKYTKVTSYPPRLSSLEFFTKIVNLDKSVTPISVATLGVDDGSTDVGMTVEYHCVGYSSKNTIDKIQLDTPIHAVVVDGEFTQIHKRLDKDLVTLDEVKQARIGRGSILSDKDKPTENGLVL
jgi:hypothetical protein